MHQPICLAGTGSILCNAENVLGTLIKLEAKIECHYDNVLNILNDKKDPSVAPFCEAHKIVKRLQEMMYEYAEKIHKCPYPGCGNPLLL
jgi:hypothetical protein